MQGSLFIIHLVNKGLLNTFYVVGSDLGTGYTLNNSDMVLAPLDLQPSEGERK